MKTKFLITISVAAAAFFMLPACTKELAELNKNPNAFEKIVPKYMFTNSLLSGVDVNFNVDGGVNSASHTLIAQALQQFATHSETVGIGDKYFAEGSVRNSWRIYTESLLQINSVIRNVQGPNDVNKLSASRIWRVYLFHLLTDLYGDVPYSEAGQAVDGLITPKYDRQEDIYMGMLNELEEAALAFDPALPTFESSDLFYQGDVVKWRKFAYSMMLRLGMRLTEVKPEVAETWVKKAIQGGVITQDDEIARIPYIDGTTIASRNPKVRYLLEQDYQNPQNGVSNTQGGKYAETFINHLKNTKDPRLNVMAVVWVDSPTGTGVVYDTTSAIQRGMKNGVYFGEPDDFNTFSEPHPNTVLNYASPILVMTNAEVYLLMAEAAIRGWYNGSATEAYENAVRAGMRQWALFGNEGVISTEKIAHYLSYNPFKATGTFEEQLEQISVQKWIVLFMDNYELFSNWRRTGYPTLIPTNYPGNITGGKIPRRFIIPESENNLNEANFQEALQRQGVGNTLLSTVWWDPEYPN